MLDDHRRGGITAELLDGVSTQPIHDAVPLRYLATAHLLALTGRGAQLARHYPSCGGRWSPRTTDALIADFLALAVAERDEFSAGLRRNVQTNEVGRAAVLASGFATIAARSGVPLDQIEIGSSAGLLSRWDRFGYDTGASRCGDLDSTVHFGPQWWSAGRPDLASRPVVARRRACDISPIDVMTDHGRATTMSFVWPDQMVRVERLRAAIEIAVANPVAVHQDDAGRWLADQLSAGLDNGVATVVFHSIVWQYLPRTTKDALRTALYTSAETATTAAPLYWLRMEPATATSADLRLTTWPGGHEEVLADVGYHGADIRWHDETPSATE